MIRIIKARLAISLFFCCFILLFGCEGPSALFKAKYAHQQYAARLRSAGLEKSALYQQWLQAATQSLANPQVISIPYQEEAYFATNRPQAAAFVFEARKGERLEIALEVQSLDSVQLFIDLFEKPSDSLEEPEHLVSADTTVYHLSYEVDDDGSYLLRIQPELLVSLSYQMQITAEPSLASPIAATAKSHIGSFFGDGRDAGSRKHEGVDIFASRFTPAVAAADGLVTRVGTNRLGGNVVWLRPQGKSLSLYYAHLDTQLVTAGKMVHVGDTLGLVGNTGNARTTPPHLHFGIYTSGGAVDPLPFLRPQKSNPPKIVAEKRSIGDTLRIQRSRNSFTVSGSQTLELPRYTPVYVEGVTQNSYRIVLPDGQKGLIPEAEVGLIAKPLRSLNLKYKQILYNQPDTLAAQLDQLAAGASVKVLAEYNGFSLIAGEKRGWILRD